MTTNLFKTHKELAEQIVGKKILLMNSLGKDSIACLEWLYNYAKPSKIISLNFKFAAPHPKDEIYIKYLKKRYPDVQFEEIPNPFEVGQVALGIFQEPLYTIKNLNNLDYDTFLPNLVEEEMRQFFECDYICVGRSRYESFDRAVFFHKNGLLKGHHIYPIGMMSKKEVIGCIAGSGVKLHPVYLDSKGSLDQPSYYKYKRAFDRFPEYKKAMFEIFPFLRLDQYRYEVLFGKK